MQKGAVPALSTLKKEGLVVASVLRVSGCESKPQACVVRHAQKWESLSV